MSMLHTILSLVSRYTERGAILIILNVFLVWANAAPEWQAVSLGWHNRVLVVACPLEVRWSGFPGQPLSLTSEAGHHP
jgi:hypothetical protein